MVMAGESARSARQHKAWGVSPRKQGQERSISSRSERQRAAILVVAAVAHSAGFCFYFLESPGPMPTHALNAAQNSYPDVLAGRHAGVVRTNLSIGRRRS